MVPLLRAAAEDDVRRLRRGDLAGEPLDNVGVHLADLGDPVGRVVCEAFGKQLEARLGLHRGAVGQRHVIGAGERERVGVGKLERRGGDERARLLVVGHVALAVFGNVRNGRDARHLGGQDALAGFHVYEYRRVGERLHEVRVVQALVDDDLRHAQCERAVGVGREAHPFVGLLGRGGVVRVEAHHAAARLAREVQEMRVRQARHHDVRAEDERELRVFPAIRLELLTLAAERLGPEHRQVAVQLVAADDRPAERVGDAHERAFLDMPCALHLVDDADRFGAVLFHDRSQLLGRGIERGVPIGFHLLAVGALHAWLRQPVGPVQQRVDGQPLQAPARIVVLVRVVGGLANHLHLAVFHERLHAARARAVRRAGRPEPRAFGRRGRRKRFCCFHARRAVYGKRRTRRGRCRDEGAPAHGLLHDAPPHRLDALVRQA